jgi:hypothetical protein
MDRPVILGLRGSLTMNHRTMNRAAYLVILTIDALQVTTGKENIANARGTSDCRFLSMMDAY